MSVDYQILVCRGPYCGNQCQSSSLHAKLVRIVADRSYESRVQIGWQSCFGRCARGPNILVRPKPQGLQPLVADVIPMFGPRTALYNGVREDELARIVDEHIGREVLCRDLMNRDPYVPLPAGTAREP